MCVHNGNTEIITSDTKFCIRNYQESMTDVKIVTRFTVKIVVVQTLKAHSGAPKKLKC
jgi:hypothetical protein